MALCSFIYVPHFLVKIPRIALTKVPPASACESVITKDPGGLWRGAGHAEGSLGAGGRAASPVPAGGRLVRYSLCVVLRQGAGQCQPLCARLPSPCAAEERTRPPAPSGTFRLTASHTTPLAAVRGGVWNPARPPSPQDPVPVAGGQAGPFLVSHLRAETGQGNRKALHSRRQGARLTWDLGAAAAPPHLAAGGSAHCFLCTRHVPHPCHGAARLPLSPHVAWGTVPAKTPPAPAHGPAPQSLRFERQLKKTKAVSYCGWSMSQTFNCTVCAAYSRRWPAKSPGTRA